MLCSAMSCGRTMGHRTLLTESTSGGAVTVNVLRAGEESPCSVVELMGADEVTVKVLWAGDGKLRLMLGGAEKVMGGGGN